MRRMKDMGDAGGDVGRVWVRELQEDAAPGLEGQVRAGLQV